LAVPRSVFDLFGDQRNVDPFRLVILGFASLEDQLHGALAEAFDDQLPDELRRSYFKARLALARALTLISDDFRDPLGLLKKLRDDFAHGKLNDLSRSEASRLYAAIKKLAPDVVTQLPTLKDEDPPIILMTFLAILEVGLNADVEDWRERRARREEAMREWAERRRPPALTAEQIRELLRDAEQLEV